MSERERELRFVIGYSPKREYFNEGSSTGITRKKGEEIGKKWKRLWKPSIHQINFHHHSIKELSRVSTPRCQGESSLQEFQRNLFCLYNKSFPVQLNNSSKGQYTDNMVNIKEGKTKTNLIPNQGT